ncbi:MAG: hypothetical protein LBR23_09815 [Spirochaetaceae bacterium]|jgi:hypothetical protein|nr:hypothetical protein [Spirochaetaceae bacterium]
MAKKDDRDPAEFWRQYEEEHNERVLAFSLGRYISGWDLYPAPFWGILIATTGGFRVHHFAQESWLQALSRSAAGGEGPKEKTIFIPKDRITGVEFLKQKGFLRNLLFYRPPRMVVHYRDDSGAEASLVAEGDDRVEGVVSNLG